MISNETITAIFIILIAIMLLFFLFCSPREEDGTYQPVDSETLEQMEEKANDIYNQRIQLIIESVNMIWNSLVIEQWLQCDQVKVEDTVKTTSLIFSDDVITVYSTYIPRSLKVICQLAWTKQKMYVRVEQQLEVGIIEVEKEFNVKAGVLSAMQAGDISDEYFDSLVELTGITVDAAPTEAIEEKEEVKSEN